MRPNIITKHNIIIEIHEIPTGERERGREGGERGN